MVDNFCCPLLCQRFPHSNHWNLWICSCFSVSKSCLTLCDPMNCSISGFPVLHSLPEFRSNSCPFSQWCHPTISSSADPFSCPQFFPASGSFPDEIALCIRRPKYWSFSFINNSSNEYSGVISFRTDWFDFLAVPGTSRVFSSTTIWICCLMNVLPYGKNENYFEMGKSFWKI